VAVAAALTVLAPVAATMVPAEALPPAPPTPMAVTPPLPPTELVAPATDALLTLEFSDSAAVPSPPFPPLKSPIPPSPPRAETATGKLLAA
jgi:hypothetical protein